MLKREMAQLVVAQERDKREGRSKEAERKAKYLEAMKDAVEGKNKRARLTVDMDFTVCLGVCCVCLFCARVTVRI